MIHAAMALERLREGNRRFASGQPAAALRADAVRRAELMAGQRPFAVVLGCSDSRVPAELVFDQGFGDLFVIRVAGNIVAPSQIASVEVAASLLGSRLVVVLGHSQCWAISATLEAVRGGAPPETRSIQSIVDRVRPSVEPLLAAGRAGDSAALFQEAVRANVRASTGRLRNASELLVRLIREEGLRVVGADYSLETGRVEFFDGADGMD